MPHAFDTGSLKSLRFRSDVSVVNNFNPVEHHEPLGQILLPHLIAGLVGIILARAQLIRILRFSDRNDLERKQNEDDIDVDILQDCRDVRAAVRVLHTLARAQTSPLPRIGGECDSLLAPITSDLERLSAQNKVGGGSLRATLSQEKQLGALEVDVSAQAYAQPGVGEIGAVVLVDKTIGKHEGLF